MRLKRTIDQAALVDNCTAIDPREAAIELIRIAKVLKVNVSRLQDVLDWYECCKALGFTSFTDDVLALKLAGKRVAPYDVIGSDQDEWPTEQEYQAIIAASGLS